MRARLWEVSNAATHGVDSPAGWRPLCQSTTSCIHSRRSGRRADRRLVGLLRDSVVPCCAQPCQLQRTPRVKLLKYGVVITNNRPHNAEVVSSSLTLPTPVI